MYTCVIVYMSVTCCEKNSLKTNWNKLQNSFKKELEQQNTHLEVIVIERLDEKLKFEKKNDCIYKFDRKTWRIP